MPSIQLSKYTTAILHKSDNNKLRYANINNMPFSEVEFF